MKNIKLLRFLMILPVFTVTAVAVDLNDVQARNESHINLVSDSFGSLSDKNKQDMAQINIESTIKSNKMKINNLQITGSNMPNIDTSTLVANKIDINDLVKQSQFQLKQDPLNTYISLYLSFTTLSKDDIILYSSQAVKYKIPIILRGFINNSYKETSAYLKELRTLYPELTIMIDPPAYEKYSITSVPALVVTKSTTSPLQDGCAAPGDFTKVSGEVSVQAMLDYIRQNSKNQIIISAVVQRFNDVRQKSYFKVN